MARRNTLGLTAADYGAPVKLSNISGGITRRQLNRLGLNGLSVDGQDLSSCFWKTENRRPAYGCGGHVGSTLRIQHLLEGFGKTGRSLPTSSELAGVTASMNFGSQ